MTTTNRADESRGRDETKNFNFLMTRNLRDDPEALRSLNQLVKLLLREKKKASGWYKVEVTIVGSRYPTAQKKG
jgi:hypothetical protein